MSFGKAISAVVILIGLYMVVMNFGNGVLTPPVLSGVALVLLGIQHCVKS